MEEKKRKITSMECLTEDITMEIFLRLPVKSTVRCRCVCMSWRKLLTGDFVKVKLNHDKKKKLSLLLNPIQEWNGESHVYFIDNSLLSPKSSDRPEKLRRAFCNQVYVFGTCNGLVCASFGHGFYIWNPCTREYRIILTVQDCDFSDDETVQESHRCDFPNWDLDKTGYGFCYDSKIQDYKVVVFFRSYDYHGVEVYTLGADSWKTLPPIPYRIPKHESHSRRGLPGVFLNGALHWVVDSLQGKTKEEELRWEMDSFKGKEEKLSKVLLSFNVEDERFQEISEPDEKWVKFDYKFVGVVGGNLCMLCSTYQVSCEVWVMNEYGVKASWAKLFEINQVLTNPFNYLRSIVDLRNNEILLDDEMDTNRFLLYDTKLKTVRSQPIRLPETEKWGKYIQYNSRNGQREVCQYNRRHIFEYVESLVPVGSGTRIGDAQEELDFLAAEEGIEY